MNFQVCLFKYTPNNQELSGRTCEGFACPHPYRQSGIHYILITIQISDLFITAVNFSLIKYHQKGKPYSGVQGHNRQIYRVTWTGELLDFHTDRCGVPIQHNLCYIQGFEKEIVATLPHMCRILQGQLNAHFIGSSTDGKHINQLTLLLPSVQPRVYQFTKLG
jgi:hypothetical protein